MKIRLQVVGNVVKRVAKRHMETKKAAVCLSPRFHSKNILLSGNRAIPSSIELFPV
jgi:ribosomal protein L31E